MTYHLFGLAFTSPTAIVPAIDSTKFKVFVYDGAISALNDFMAPQPTNGSNGNGRKLVILCSSVNDLKQIQSIPGIHAFLLFEDPATLKALPGTRVLDCTTGPASRGWQKLGIRPDQLNAHLSSDPDPTSVPAIVEPQVAVTVEKALEKPAGLRDLVQKTLVPITDTSVRTAIEQAICEYVTGQLNKRSWNSRVVKPIRAASNVVESLIELERFTDGSKECDGIWRAYYDHAEGGLSIEDAAARYVKCDLDDLKYVCTFVKPLKGLKYLYCAKDVPYTAP